MSAPAAESGAAMLARMYDLVAGMGPRPIASMLHVGSKHVLELLKQAAGWRPTHGPQVLNTLFGVRIVVGSLNTALPLDEMGWRLLDTQGEIISEGILQ